ncbi:MAG: hypothetical protein IAF02_15735, partial [Anaerolineae bacterium]|nr:hypothetical protein [Anaerolineae bacterium]
MNTRSINKRTVILFLALAIIAASGIAFAAKRTPHRNTQMTLPLALPQVKTDKIMPPDPDDWCKKVKLSKLDYEIEKAEEYFASGFGGSLIRWNYLRL